MHTQIYGQKYEQIKCSNVFKRIHMIKLGVPQEWRELNIKKSISSTFRLKKKNHMILPVDTKMEV